MNRYYIEHAIVAALGFLIGAAFAMAIVPGNALALLGTGMVFGFSAHVLFAQDFAGDWFWLFGRHAGGKAMARAPSSGQRAVIEQARSIPKACGVGPGPRLQASPEPGNVTAEDVQDNLDEIDAMISEGSPTR